ncbi:hypothetical protein THAOC_10774 [Thalassiosira oceanica]|uniref:Uncharacterized protein n=1 Tax=Thalassiosira oceanica TaxID=159749 RepID=K0SP24_THAOC|nr:hypothetical protein THAOC_10774 [Thalassiosira oceanica]|eukprot:EJK68088.1 hypothetical protein THAOC_10774 [Thalassiosira oceanica]
MLWYTSLLLAFLAISVVSTTRKIGHPTIFSLSFLTRRRRETPTANLFFDFQDGKADEDQSVTTNAAASLVAESTKGLRGLGGPPGGPGPAVDGPRGQRGQKKASRKALPAPPTEQRVLMTTSLLEAIVPIAVNGGERERGRKAAVKHPPRRRYLFPLSLSAAYLALCLSLHLTHHRRRVEHGTSSPRPRGPPRDSRGDDSCPRGLFQRRIERKPANVKDSPANVASSDVLRHECRVTSRRLKAMRCETSRRRVVGRVETIPEDAGEGQRRRGRADVVVEKPEGKSGGRALPGRGTAMSSGPPLVEDPVSGAGNAGRRRVRARG